MKYGSIERVVYEDSYCKAFSKIYINHKGYKSPLWEKFVLWFLIEREMVIKNYVITYKRVIDWEKGKATLYILNYHVLKQWEE